MSHFLLVAVLLATGDNSSSDRPTPEKAVLEFSDEIKLQGTWALASIEADGQILDAKSLLLASVRTFKITINNGKFSSPNDPKYGGTFTVDPNKWPHRVAFVDYYDEVFKSQDTRRMLYELNGDTLRFCSGNDDQFPKAFTSKGGQSIFTFKRENNAGLVRAFYAAALAADDKPPADKPKTDKDRLQGTWAVESVESNGEVLKTGDYYTNVKDMKLTFKGDTVKNSKKPNDDATYKIDPDKKPPTLDIFVKGERDVTSLLMIYEFKGDMLRLCLAAEEKMETEHAKEFTSKNNQLLITLKRVEKKPEK